MKNLYLLSGLGADKRVFNFLDFGNHNIHHIVWIRPLENESLSEYAKRLCNEISCPYPILIGVSFGGIVAMEMGKFIKTEKIILISSARTRKDIPLRFKLTGKLKLHKTIPPSFKVRNNPVQSWLFGVKTTSEKELLTSILLDTDPYFLRWAIDKLVCWKNEDLLENVKQIHGTKDKILPFK
ncbi:MAG TPA: alpha/beta hydrolase, partial [Chryseolinea sp.]|nr:alpha/beta hydrolase [Chryseolinea sp.]